VDKSGCTIAFLFAAEEVAKSKGTNLCQFATEIFDYLANRP